MVAVSKPGSTRVDWAATNGEKLFEAPYPPRDTGGYLAGLYNPADFARISQEAGACRMPIDQMEMLLRMRPPSEACSPLLPAAFHADAPFQLSACSKDGFLSAINFYDLRNRRSASIEYSYAGTGIDARLAEMRVMRAPSLIRLPGTTEGTSNGEPAEVREGLQHLGGRDIVVRYQQVEIDGHFATLPSQIDVRRGDTLAFLRGATFSNYMAHVPEENEFEAVRSRVAPAPEEIRAQQLLEQHWCRPPSTLAEEERAAGLQLRDSLRRLVNTRLTGGNTGLTLRAYRNYMCVLLVLGEAEEFSAAFAEWSIFLHAHTSTSTRFHSPAQLVTLLRRWQYEGIAVRTEREIVAHAHANATPKEIYESLPLVPFWQQTLLLTETYIRGVREPDIAAALAVAAAHAYHRLSQQDGLTASLDRDWGRSPANFPFCLEVPASEQFRTFRALADDLYGRIAEPDPALTAYWEQLRPQ